MQALLCHFDIVFLPQGYREVIEAFFTEVLLIQADKPDKCCTINISFSDYKS